MTEIRTVAQALRHLNAVEYWKRIQRRPIATEIEAMFRG